VPALLTGWTLNPLQLAAPLLLALAYAVRARDLAARGRYVAPLRQCSFYLGVAVLAFAVTSPIDTEGEHRLFWAHMLQHLLLGDIAPLLLVLGVTGPLLRPLLAVHSLQRLRAVAHPLVALPLWACNLYVWHLPVLYQAALHHDAVHGVQHMMFFGTGVLMWAAVVEPLPGPVWFGTGLKATYVLVVRTLQGALANAFIWAGDPFYGFYRRGELASGISPHADQVIGGCVMFVEGAVVTLAAFVWFFLKWYRDAELAQRLVDAGNDADAAARAARYGRSALARSARDL
jgi:cytochrome c oxidase assembly factor CtaG